MSKGQNPQAWNTPQPVNPTTWREPQPPQKKRRTWPLVLLGILGVLTLFGCISGIVSTVNDTSKAPAASFSPASSPTVADPVTTKPAASAKPSKPAAASIVPGVNAPNTVILDGTYLVGVDVKPGRYRTTGPSNAAIGMGYWQITKDENGDNIISNDMIQGPAYVNLKAGTWFKTQGCLPWHWTHA